MKSSLIFFPFLVPNLILCWTCKFIKNISSSWIKKKRWCKIQVQGRSSNRCQIILKCQRYLYSSYIRKKIQLPISWHVQVWQLMHNALDSLTVSCLQNSAYSWHLHLIKRKYFWHTCETTQSGIICYSLYCAIRTVLEQNQETNTAVPHVLSLFNGKLWVQWFCNSLSPDSRAQLFHISSEWIGGAKLFEPFYR